MTASLWSESFNFLETIFCFTSDIQMKQKLNYCVNLTREFAEYCYSLCNVNNILKMQLPVKKKSQIHKLSDDLQSRVCSNNHDEAKK